MIIACTKLQDKLPCRLAGSLYERNLRQLIYKGTNLSYVGGSVALNGIGSSFPEAFPIDVWEIVVYGGGSVRFYYCTAFPDGNELYPVYVRSFKHQSTESILDKLLGHRSDTSLLLNGYSAWKSMLYGGEVEVSTILWEKAREIFDQYYGGLTEVTRSVLGSFLTMSKHCFSLSDHCKIVDLIHSIPAMVSSNMSATEVFETGSRLSKEFGYAKPLAERFGSSVYDMELQSNGVILLNNLLRCVTPITVDPTIFSGEDHYFINREVSFDKHYVEKETLQLIADIIINNGIYIMDMEYDFATGVVTSDLSWNLSDEIEPASSVRSQLEDSLRFYLLSQQQPNPEDINDQTRGVIEHVKKVHIYLNKDILNIDFLDERELLLDSIRYSLTLHMLFIPDLVDVQPSHDYAMMDEAYTAYLQL